ncbi:hypothetical protein CCMSSC00406_0007176 [Pleurotus cornucopiae]|uniref:Uncharacterized protein n=1 Tax=Pleurotus cornucopiae TaxID=5321 RepID=A0ACB7IQV8_PLECO|nr:hypothetical protein CCMSSC00406_0007176 [Pleurotus cornucopiae]
MPKSLAAEATPRAKKPVPINGSSHSVLQKNAAPQGRSGMTRGSSPSLQQPQQQAPYQPRSSYIPSSPQPRSFSPPLSPKLDAQPTMQGKPLIFSAMHAVHDVPQGNRISDDMGLGGASPPKMAHNAAFAYPSPPMEFSPSPLDRPLPLPSQNLLANLRTESPLVRPQPLYETQTPPPTPPKEHQPPQRALGTSPQVLENQLPTGKVLNRRDSPDRQINHYEASPSASRSGSPLNHRTSLHHIRKLSKSSLATRSQVNSQASSNGSLVNVASGAKGGSHPGHTRSRSGTVSSRLIPPADPNRDSETDSMLLDDDPFARVEGVKLLPASNESTSKHRRTPSTPDSVSSLAKEKRTRTTSKPSSVEGVSQDEHPLGKPDSSPVKPGDYREARTMRRGEGLEKPPAFMADMPIRKDRTPIPFPLEVFLADPTLLSGLLAYLTFSEWCRLSTMNKQIRALLTEAPGSKEIILERYLSTVGYARWIYDGVDPLPLSIRDLNDYMRGVSTPTHEYSRVAGLYIQSRANRGIPGYDAIQETARSLSACTRAYSRVVLRLRAQAEAQYVFQSAQQPRAPPPAIFNYNGVGSSGRSMSSRAPSPSSMSHSHAHSSVMGHQATHGSSPGTSTFRSPLYRLRRAPLLRVFVPSQEEWLSDAGVVDCENELRRAGIVDLMRLGDVVWDVAVGDEGNVGRLVWDGSYLLDLDYAYSSVGDLPKYIRSLAFPPSYFHRVIRTGSSNSNPIAHIDVSPWGEEIAANLQLLQDRVRTETPQGAYHNVVRWVHRSSFTIRPGRGRTPNSRPSSRPSSRAGSRPTPNSIMQIGNSSRIHIPDTDGLCVDPGWYGTVIVETEGTNEALADLQDRCGPGAFPPRATPTHERFTPTKDKEAKRIFRILRERSRPGEIWIRAVSAKERLL